jgi:hypothetical protein
MALYRAPRVSRSGAETVQIWARHYQALRLFGSRVHRYVLAHNASFARDDLRPTSGRSSPVSAANSYRSLALSGACRAIIYDTGHAASLAASEGCSTLACFWARIWGCILCATRNSYQRLLCRVVSTGRSVAELGSV